MPSKGFRQSLVVCQRSVRKGVCRLAKHADALSHGRNTTPFRFRLARATKEGVPRYPQRSLRYHRPDTMDKFGPSDDSSRSGTPSNGRFASQAATAEDLLKAQTVGLVNLDDYRKRRAEAIELKERGSPAVSSGNDAPLEGYGLRLHIWNAHTDLPSTEHRHRSQRSRRSER